MKEPSDLSTDWDDLWAKIFGPGERSIRESYYPELKRRLIELERLRVLLDQSSDLIFLVQIPSGRFIDGNGAACRQLGYSRDALLALSVRDLVPRPVWESMAALFADEGQVGQDGTTIVTTFKHDGGEMPVEMSVRLVAFSDAVYAVIVARDIAERTQAESEQAATLAALQESEEKYRQLFELESDAVFLIENETGQILEANATASTMYGYSREELLNKRNADLSAEPEETQRVTQTTPVEVEHVVSVPLRFHRQEDGTVFPVEITGRFFTWRGRPVHIAAIRDITARKRAEEQLRQLKEFNEGIVQNMAVGIAVEDAAGYFTFVNPAAATLLGYAPEELVDRHWMDVVPPDQQPIVRTADERRMHDQADRYELELVRKDGTRFPVLVSGSPRFDVETGDFAGTLAVFTDISRQLRAEEALRRRTEQLEALHQVGLEVAAQLDLDALLHSIVSRAVDLVGGIIGGFYLYRPDRNVLEVVVAIGVDPAVVGRTLRPGEGLAGRVWQNGEPLVVEDYRHWEGRAAIYDDQDFRATVGVQVRWGDEFLGVLNVVADAPGVLSTGDAELLSLFATQAAIAIQNARLFQEAQQRLRDLAMLFETSAAISSSLDADTVMQAAARQITAALEIEGCAISAWDREQDAVVTLMDYSSDLDCWGPDTPGTIYRLDDYPATRRVLTERRPAAFQVSDSHTDPFEEAWMREQEVKALLMLPFVVRDKAIGLLELMETRKEREFTPTEIGLCQTLANQAAAALENARLFQAEREQRELAEVLTEAAQVMGASLDLNEILRLILDQLKRVLAYDTASVVIFREGNVPDLVVGLGYADERMTSREARDLLPDSPILRRMSRDLQPVVSADVRQLDGWIWVPGAEHVRSWLAVPLLARERMIGALMADHSQPGFFGQAELQVAQVLARHAAQAIENARLFEAEQQQAREAAALGAIAQALNGTTDLASVFQVVARHLGRVVDFDRLSIALSGNGEEQFTMYALSAQEGAPLAPGVTLPLSVSAAAADIIAGRPHLTPDLSAELDFAAERTLYESGLRSRLNLPLLLGETVVGTLNLASCQPRAFSRDQLPLLNQVADAIAAAVQSVRLYEETARGNRELALLNRVIAASAASQEIEPILETVCRELAMAFEVSHSAAALLNAKRTEVVVVAEHRAEGRPSALGQTVPVADIPLAQHLLQQKAPLLIDDARADSRLGPICDLIDPSGTIRLLILPIPIEGEIAGSLGVVAVGPRSFSPEEVDLAWRVAEQVAGSLARARLAETERRLSAAVEQAAEAVIITDIEGAILYVNPAFEQIVGYNRAEVIDQKPCIFRRSGVDPELHQQMWQAVTTGQVWQERFDYKRRDSSLCTLDMTTAPVRDQAGEIINYVATMRDVTREVQLERQFQQAHKMEALGRLAGGVAHDFNNLLTVIQISIQMLQRELHPEDPLLEHVRYIRDTSERAARLTQQLLSFSRREVIQPRVLNLNQAVGDLSRMLQRILGEDVRLTTALAADLWPVRADPSQTDQMILNLAVNARDAMPGGGVLTIETANVVLDEAYTALHVDAQPGEHVLLVVSDTGIGMDDEVKARIFEPFFSTKERGQGTGLGLATVFGIIKQSDGHIEVHSEVGQGTTFKIYLPRIWEAEALPEAPFRALPPIAVRLARGTETVLLVEDDAPVRELAMRVLESCGYQVLAAGDGLQALQIGQQHDGPIHLLLTDVVLPQMSGKELAAQLHAARPEMEVLYMSGYADNTIAQHGVLAPGVALLSKPFTIEDLTQRVREVLDRDA